MRTRNTLNEKEMELVKYLVSDCGTTGDVQECKGTTYLRNAG